MRSGREAQRIDEQREGEVFQVGADGDTHLTNGQRDEQRAADAADLNRSQTDFSYKIAQRQRQEQRNDRISKQPHRISPENEVRKLFCA